MSNGENRIEITENTLLKLLVRRGTDAERENVVISEAELGYTVDTKRLFVGDGSTYGGNPISAYLFYGSGDPTQWTAAIQNDMAYNTSNGGLYILTDTIPTTLSNWQLIGGAAAVRVDGTTITINGSTSTISVGTVSAANIDPGLAGVGLEFVGTTLQTKAIQEFDTIRTRDADVFSIPNIISFGSVNNPAAYNIPSYDGPVGYSLKTNGNAELYWGPDNTTMQMLVLSGNQIPVGTIVAFGSGGNFNNATTTIPYGYVVCNGASYSVATYPSLYGALSTFYGGSSGISFSVPSISASNTIYLIKAIDEPVIQQATISINSGLTAVDNTSSVVTTLTIPNTGINYTIGVATSGIKTFHIENRAVTTDKIALSSVSLQQIQQWSGMMVKATYSETQTVCAITLLNTWTSLPLSASITKTASGNYVRIQGMVNVIPSSIDNPIGMRIVRYADDVATLTAIGVGAAAGNRILVTASSEDTTSSRIFNTLPIDIWDRTTSDVVAQYAVQIYARSNAYFNRTQLDTDSAIYSRGISTLTLTEIQQ